MLRYHPNAHTMTMTHPKLKRDVWFVFVSYKVGNTTISESIIEDIAETEEEAWKLVRLAIENAHDECG